MKTNSTSLLELFNFYVNFTAYVDYLTPILFGILEATLKGKQAMISTMIAFYAFGQPISIYTCFWLKWKVFGLWFGFTIGCWFVDAFLIYFIWTLDWDK